VRGAPAGTRASCAGLHLERGRRARGRAAPGLLAAPTGAAPGPEWLPRQGGYWHAVADLLSLQPAMGSLIKKRRKRMRKKKHKKMLKATRWQRRAGK